MHIASLYSRDRELDAIAALLRRAAAGHGGALLIEGELGLGKTALLDRAAAQATGFTVLTTAGYDDEAGLPYAAVHRLLQPVAGRVRTLPEVQAAVLSRAVHGGGCARDERLLLSVAVLDLLGRVGHEQPVLCTVDDAHALDPASARLLAFVARRVDASPVAVVFGGSWDGTEHPFGGVPALRLAGLDQHGSRRMLADLVPEGLPAGAGAILAAVGAGNPQALADLARSLTTAQREGDEPLPTVLPPESLLRRAYRARLVRLPARTRWLLLVAAADEELDAAGLVRAAHVSGVDIAALAPAEKTGLVRVDHSGVSFAQPVVRALAYEEAPLAQRRAAHLLLARTLDHDRQRLRRAVHLAAAAPGPDPRLAAELADAAGGLGKHTAEHTGGYATASAALERAAQLTAEPARAATRLVDAARYAWLAGSPNRARMLLYRVRPAAEDRDVEGRTQLLAGEMELRSGAAAAALQSLLAAADKLADGHRHLAIGALMRAGEAICFCGDLFRYADIERRAAVLRRPDEPLGAELMFEYIAGFSATFQGRHRHAIGPLRRVVALAAQLDEAAALTWASAASLLLADDGGAYRHAARAVELARACGGVAELPRALEMMASAEYWLGRYDAATATSLEGLRSARASGQENCAGNHLAMLAVLAAVRGDRQSCQRRIGELAAAGTAGAGAPGRATRPRALSEWALAMLDVAAGRSADAVTRLDALADPATGRGHVVVQVMATPHLVEAAARSADRSDRSTKAATALDIFDRWAGSTGDPARRALVARCRALLAPRGSGEAEEQFREALRLHRAGGVEFEQARTQLLYGRELRRCRRPRDAREHLHSAAETFQRFAARTWVDQANAELRAAGEQVDAGGVAVAETLTAQQWQIARLVVEGATNREVAAQLLLSTRTVDHHMRNIFSRLGIRSRVELARLLS